MGSIRQGEKLSAAPRPLCVALSPSLDLDAGFYIAERSIFLSSLEHLESGLDSATCEDLAHTMIGIDYSDCISFIALLSISSLKSHQLCSALKSRIDLVLTGAFSLTMTVGHSLVCST